MTITKSIVASLLCACAMAQSNQSTPVLACNMKAISSTERIRYNTLLEKLKTAVQQQKELADGYAWDLNGKRITLPEAAEWMTMERRCCPFLTLQLEATGNEVDFRINLKGPAGVKAFLVSEFGIGR